MNDINMEFKEESSQGSKRGKKKRAKDKGTAKVKKSRGDKRVEVKDQDHIL